MSTGTEIVRVFWSALGLKLPASRRSPAVRFFAGLKPLQLIGYASLLRAFARTLVESGYLPVRKDARHDPVELIAAALEISIEQWDHLSQSRGSASAALTLPLFDIVMRAAAFEGLFQCRLPDACWSAAIDTIAADTSHPDRHDALRRMSEAFEGARRDVSKALDSKAVHLDALLAELVVLGAASRSARLVFNTREAERADIHCETRAVPLAQGMALLRVGRVIDALALFETIIDRVPGHTLALEQAARCCTLAGETARAHSYSKRASRLGRTLKRRDDVLSSDVKVVRERPWPRRNGAVSLDRYGAAVASEATR